MVRPPSVSAGAWPFAASAGGAQDYSPERSAAELRDLTPIRPNPFQGVTERQAPQARQRIGDGTAFRRPFSGALPFLFDKPGVTLRSSPGFNPPHPPGALDFSSVMKAQVEQP